MANYPPDNSVLAASTTKIPLPSDGSNRYERYTSKSNFVKLKENYRHKLLGNNNRPPTNVQNDQEYEQDYDQTANDKFYAAKVHRNNSSSQVYPKTTNRSVSTESLYKSDNETNFTRQSTKDLQYYASNRSFSRFSDTMMDRHKPRILRSGFSNAFSSNTYPDIRSPFKSHFTDDSNESCFMRGYEQLQQQMHARRMEVERMTVARESIAEFYMSKADRPLEPMKERGQMFPPISPNISAKSAYDFKIKQKTEALKPITTRQDTFSLETDIETNRPESQALSEDSFIQPVKSNPNCKTESRVKKTTNKTSLQDPADNRSYSEATTDDASREDDPIDNPGRRRKNSKKLKSSQKL